MWYLLFAVFSMASAATYDGQCPDLDQEIVQNFNVTAWLETWYFIYQYSDDPVLQGACPFGRETPNGNTDMVQKWYVTNGIQNAREGVATVAPDANNSAKYDFSFKNQDVYLNYTGVVIATDYTNYGVVYNCKYDVETNTHQAFPWNVSRTKVLQGNSKNIVDEIVQNSSFLDSSKFVQNDYSEEACAFSSTTNLSKGC